MFNMKQVDIQHSLNNTHQQVPLLRHAEIEDHICFFNIYIYIYIEYHHEPGKTRNLADHRENKRSIVD